MLESLCVSYYVVPVMDEDDFLNLTVKSLHFHGLCMNVMLQ